MGEPYFKVEKIVKKNDVKVFSSNYALYGDLSRRVMKTLKQFSPRIEIYSIDEAFLDLSSIKNEDLLDYGNKIRKTILKWTGIPTSIGIATTKTLSKAANHIAKKEKTGVINYSILATTSLVIRTVCEDGIWKSINGIGVVKWLSTQSHVKNFSFNETIAITYVVIRLNNPNQFFTWMIEVQFDFVGSSVDSFFTGEL